MARKIIRTKKTFEETKPADIDEVIPEEKYIVTLSNEDTKFLLIYKDEKTAMLLAMDGTYEAVAIPISQFNRGKYSFEADGKRVNATLEVHQKE